jgi:hypothetical protein
MTTIVLGALTAKCGSLRLDLTAPAVGTGQHALVRRTAVGRQGPEHIRRKRTKRCRWRHPTDFGGNLCVTVPVTNLGFTSTGREDRRRAKNQVRRASFLIGEHRDLAEDVGARDVLRALEILRRCEPGKDTEHRDCGHNGHARDWPKHVVHSMK